MSVYVHYETKREAPVPKSHENVLLRQRQVSNKAPFLLICVSENANVVSECQEDMCLVKNGSDMYLGDDGVKELIIIYDHVYVFHKNEWTQEYVLFPKGEGPWLNPCDTDTGNEHPAGGLGSCYPSVVVSTVSRRLCHTQTYYKFVVCTHAETFNC